MQNASRAGAATAGGLLLAGIVGGLVVGLSMTNGGAAGGEPEQTSTGMVESIPANRASAAEAAPSPILSVETPAPIVETVTTPEPVIAAPAETTTEAYVPPAPAPANPAPQVTQGEGIIVGPSTSFDAPVAPPAPVGVAPTEPVNAG